MGVTLARLVFKSLARVTRSHWVFYAQGSANFTVLRAGQNLWRRDSPQLPTSSSSTKPLSSSLSSMNFEGATVSSSNERSSSSLISGECAVAGTFPLLTRLLNGLVLAKLALIFPLKSNIRLPGVAEPGGVRAHDSLTKFSTICPSHGQSAFHPYQKIKGERSLPGVPVYTIPTSSQASSKLALGVPTFGCAFATPAR